MITNDSGFVLSRAPDTVRGPDVSFVSRERLAIVTDPAKAFPGAPDLAVEVRSPSNTLASIRAKVADYLAAGDALEGQDLVPGFVASVAQLFEV